jgi:hypothetical protein
MAGAADVNFFDWVVLAVGLTLAVVVFFMERRRR